LAHQRTPNHHLHTPKSTLDGFGCRCTLAVRYGQTKSSISLKCQPNRTSLAYAGRPYGGEGGIRTHDTLASMPHFECGAFNHSTTSPFGPGKPLVPSRFTRGGGRVMGWRPRNWAERTVPTVSRPAPKFASHRGWTMEAQADRDENLRSRRKTLMPRARPFQIARLFRGCGRSHIDFAGGLDNSAARDGRGAVLSARRTRKLKGKQ
jgi:hypothetical protein